MYSKIHYLVNSIWPVLRLQTESTVFGVRSSTFCLYCPIQEVGCVELNPRLSSAHLQNTSCPRMHHSMESKVQESIKTQKESTLHHHHIIINVIHSTLHIFVPAVVHPVSTDRSCGQSQDQEALLVWSQEGQAFSGQTMCSAQVLFLL